MLTAAKPSHYYAVKEVFNLGFTKRADIVNIDNDHKKKLISLTQCTVRKRKESPSRKGKILESFRDYFINKYGISNWEIIGLLFAARGSITKFTVDVFHRFSPG